MPLSIEGTDFYTVSELAEELDVSRQTLWRWRSKGDVPQGRRFRNREVVFTEREAAEIRQYAYRLEPIDPGNHDQLGLFNGTKSGGAA